jgi:hypothetical protein
LSIETINVNFLSKEKRQLLDQINEKPIYFLEESTFPREQLIRIVAVEDSAIAKDPQEGQDHADLIRNNNFEGVRVVQNEPQHADDGADIGKQALEASRNGVWNQAEEGAMLVDDDGVIVGLGEGLVVVRREDVRLVVMLSGSQAQVHHQLLSAPDSKVRMDECYLLHSYIINSIK